MHDFISYDVDNQTLEYLNKNPNCGQPGGSKSNNGNTNNNPDGKNEPSPVALRATIDCERDEIYIFSVSVVKKNFPKQQYFYKKTCLLF